MTTSLANRQIKNQAVDAPKTDPTIIISAGTNPFTGDQSLGLHKLIDLAMPTNQNDAASKAYVDSVSGGATQMSITSDLGGLKLVNDEATPAVDKYYGTNASGALGYHSLTGIGYTDEQAQDAAAAMLVNGAQVGINFVYNDIGNTISTTVTSIPWTGITGTPTTLAGYGIADAQPLDADLTSLAGLIITGNALKVIRVNAAETGYELATVSAGGGGSTIAVADNNTLNATVYPLWVTAAGDVPLFISTTKIQINPSLGTLILAGDLITTVGGKVRAADSVTGSSLISNTTIVAGMGTQYTGSLQLNSISGGQVLIKAADTNQSSTFILPSTGGSTGQTLQSTGSGGTAWGSPTLGISDTTLPNASVYPLWVTGAGATSARITTTRWSFNPSSGYTNLVGTFHATALEGNQLTLGTPSVTGYCMLYDSGRLLTVRAAQDAAYTYTWHFPDGWGLSGQILRAISTTGVTKTEWADASNLKTSASDITNGMLFLDVGNNMGVWLQNDYAAFPTSIRPLYMTFRDPSLTSSAHTIVTISDLVPNIFISSGSTLGVAGPNIPFRLWVVAFKTGTNTVQLGIVNLLTVAANAGGAYTVQSIRPLSDDTLDSASVDDLSGTADQAGTIYTSTTAIVDKPMRILGYLQWSGGLDTPGYWDRMPDVIQMYGSHVPAPGSVVQKRRWLVTAGASGTTPIPFDATIPQDTEGTQFMVMDVFSKSGANIFSIDALLFFTHSAIATIGSALFRRAGITTFPNARCSVANTISVAGHIIQQRLRHMELVQFGGATLTYSIRSGAPGAGTLYFNRTSGINNLHGGVCTSVMEIEEIMG